MESQQREKSTLSTNSENDSMPGNKSTAACWGDERQGIISCHDDSNYDDTAIEEEYDDRPLTQRKRLFHTLCAYTAYLSLGLISASVGPSLMDLKELLYTDTTTIMVVFTCISGGMLGGTIVSGYLIEKLNDIFFFLVASLCMSVSYMSSVWVRNLAVFCVFMALMAVFMASINCNIQVTVLKLWSHSRHQASILQGAHFTWSVGATISPFIIQPFLYYKIHPRPSNESTENETFYGPMENMEDVVLLNTRVQYGFLTIGSLTLITVVLFTMALKLDSWRLRKRNHGQKKKNVNQHRQSKSFKIIMIIGMMVLMFFYDHLEDSSGNLLSSFVVEGLRWEKYKGAVITSVFWGVFGIGRLVGVFLSQILTPIHLMYLDASLVCLGYIMLLSMIHLHEAVTWVSMGLAGLGMGSFVAAGFSFFNMYLPVDGIVSACIIGSFSVSSMSMTPITGLVFDAYGPMSMVYIVFTSSVIVLCCFIAVQVFAARFSTKERLDEDMSADGIYKKGSSTASAIV